MNPSPRSLSVVKNEKKKYIDTVARPALKKSERRKLQSRVTREIGNELRPAGEKLEESTKTTTYL